MDKELLDDGPINNGRTIRIFSTRTRKTLVTAVTTWIQLKEELRANDIPYNGMKAAIGKSKLTLEHNDAELPDEDFVLYLMPTKTKSGVDIATMPYKDLKKAISTAIATGETAYNHFNEGKNYTNKKSADLRRLYSEWLAKGNETVEVVESVQETKEESNPDTTNNPVLQQEVIEQVHPLQVILDQLKSYVNPNKEITRNVQCAMHDLQTAIDLESSPEVIAEKKRLEEEARLEQERLAEEERKKKEEEEKWQDIEEDADDFMSGFDDVEL